MSYTDYSPAAGVSYQYRIQAIGSNGVLTPSSAVTASVTWECWRFIPSDSTTALVWNEWSAPIELDQDRVEVQGRGTYTITARGPRAQRRIQLSAKFLGNGADTPEAQVSRLFTLATAGTRGWLKGPEGTTLYGELYAPRYEPQRGWAGDFAAVAVQFVERPAPN
jgi:hypothetical protein